MKSFIFLALLLISTFSILASQHSVAQPDDQAKYLNYVDSAENYIKIEKWGEAEMCIIKALRLQPANPINTMLFSNLGLCQAHQQKYADALQSYELALVKAPDAPKILMNRIRTYLMMQEYESAMKDLDHILTKDTTYYDALTLRSTLRLRDKEYDKALEDFRLMDFLQPNDPYTISGIAQCLSYLGKTLEANAEFKRSLTLSTESEILQAAIIHYIEIRDLNNADDVIRQAITSYPTDGIFYLYRSILHKLRFQNSEMEIDKKLANKYGIDTQIIDEMLTKF